MAQTVHGGRPDPVAKASATASTSTSKRLGAGSGNHRELTAGYRPDIEGLRAVAVIIVMLNHAGLPFLDGGFIGVDVFFVISGFLITTLLVKQLARRGRLRLRRFYARRARRLLPAATVVLLAVALLALLLLPRTRWASTAQDIFFSAIYGMNWLLAAQSVDYFQENSAPSPLQHFWSLAVEEQFYIFWPVLLVGVSALVIRRLGRSRLSIGLLVAFALVGVPSLAWSAYYTIANPGRAYFATTTRLWELALGGGIAILALSDKRFRRSIAVIVGWAGLLAIIVGSVLVSTVNFPGLTALVPTLGAAAVIVAGLSAGPEGPIRLLGTRPMQFIGSLSYSLYLVHWPILVFTATVFGPLNPVQGVAVMAAAIVPAYLLTRYVENPIRFSKGFFRSSAHTLRVAAVVTAVSLTVSALMAIADGPAKAPFVPTQITKLAPQAGNRSGVPLVVDGVVGAGILGDEPRDDVNGTPVDTVPSITPRPDVAATDVVSCGVSIEGSDLKSCTFGNPSSTTEVVVVGDSKAGQWLAGLDEVGKQRNWKIIAYTKGACPFADVMVAREFQPYGACREWYLALQAQILRDRPELVIASHGAYDTGRPTGGADAVNGAATDGGWGVQQDGRVLIAAEAVTGMADGMTRTYRSLSEAGIRIAVLRDTPAPGIDIPTCVIEHPTALTACAGSRFDMLSGTSGTGVGADQVRAADNNGGVRLVDLNDAICPTERCAAVIGNVLVYRDGVHLSGTYVRTLVPRLDAAFSDVLNS